MQSTKEKEKERESKNRILPTESETETEGKKLPESLPASEQSGQSEELEEAPALAPDVIYKNNIYALVDDVKESEQFSGLTDEELKNNKAFFPTLIDYIYNNYIRELLGNKKGNTHNRYPDIYQLDYLFNIYIDLVHKYKWNNKPFIVEYSTFVGIPKKTFYEWLNNNNNNMGCIDISSDSSEGYDITSARRDVVQKWIDICERALLNGSDTIRDIFILKAKHGYRDNNNDIQITVNHKNIISADDLPALIDLK